MYPIPRIARRSRRRERGARPRSTPSAGSPTRESTEEPPRSSGGGFRSNDALHGADLRRNRRPGPPRRLAPDALIAAGFQSRDRADPPSHLPQKRADDSRDRREICDSAGGLFLHSSSI